MLCCPQGLYFEAQGTPDKAEALYKKELERDPQNAMILKRMVRAAGALCCASLCPSFRGCVWAEVEGLGSKWRANEWGC